MIKKILKRCYFYILCKKNNLIIKSIEVSRRTVFGLNIEVDKNTFTDHNCKIGSYTYIGKNCNITKAIIGRYCSIANNVSIGQGEHDLKRVSTSSIFYENGYELLTSKDCIIEDDVWIGTDSIILRGVKISIGAVIGANSVVTKDVPPFAIVVGSPAKIIRYRFDKSKIEKILLSQWWKYDINEAKNLIKDLEHE